MAKDLVVTICRRRKSTVGMKRFLTGRIDLARTLHLEHRSLGVDYADVVLILTSVLSACSSIRWPGEGIDKKRFIELLVSWSPETFRTSWVSIPSLIDKGFIPEDETPYQGGHSDRGFRDDEIDLCIDDAKAKYPETRYPDLTPKVLRNHSYASLIYEWLRCGYVHEYCPHESISPAPPAGENARVSYISRKDLVWEEEKEQMVVKERKIKVSFHPDYLFDIAAHHVSNLPATISSRPSTWWIDSGVRNSPPVQ